MSQEYNYFKTAFINGCVEVTISNPPANVLRRELLDEMKSLFVNKGGRCF